MSSADVVTVVVTFIVALAGGGGYVAWRRDRRQGPIERGQAREATIRLQSEIRTADIDGLRDIIESLREQVTSLQGRVETAEARAASAEGRAVAAEHRAAAAESERRADARYIEVLIEHWPTPPLPARPAPH